MPENNDSKLIKGLIDDDKTVIDLIYNTYHKRIYAFAYSYLKVKDDALDVMHEVFMKLWENRHHLESDTNLEAFVFTITRNTVLSIFRKKATEKKYLAYLSSIVVQLDNNTQNSLDYTFLKESLGKLVENLPPKRKQVFLISRNEGLSNKEIAQRLEISEKTVEDHMTKALAFLRGKMKELGLVAYLFAALFLE